MPTAKVDYVVIEMNILFCEHLKEGGLVSESVHIYEVTSHLSDLGHDIVLLNGAYARNRVGPKAKPEIPLWRRIERKLLRWPPFRLFKSELSILGLFRHEIRVFLLTLIILISGKRRFDIIYRRHNLLNSEYLLARLFRVPLVKEVNGIIVDERSISGGVDKFSLWIIDRLERFSIPKADRIIYVTPGLKEILPRDYGVPADKMVAIPNGANTNLFKPMDIMKAREKLGLNQRNNYVCFVGNLWKVQGVEYLIRSIPLVLEKCFDTCFLIVGDGPLKRELIELADRIGVSTSIVFTGRVPYQEVPIYINASDVCVAPFIKERNERIGVSPLKLCEYLACQRPVVTSRLDGLEIVEENAAGSLVEPDSFEELAIAIIKLLQNQELRHQMGKNGRRYVLENQSWVSISKKVADVCQDLIASRRNEGKVGNN